MPEPSAQNTEDKYTTLVNSIDEGFCIIEILYDEAGKPVDWLYVEANPTFRRQSGLAPVGKTARELSGVAESYWLEFYDRILKSGEAGRAENFVESTNRWFRIFASRIGGPESARLAVIFDDITERRREEMGQAYLLRFSDAVASLTDPSEIVQAVTTAAMQYFKTDRCYYCEIDETGRVHIRRDAARAGLPTVAGIYELRDFPILRAVIAAGAPFAVPDVRTSDKVDAGMRELCIALQVISFLNIPVVKNGETVGVLCLVQSEPRDWEDVEVRLLEETTVRTWAAVERARAEAAVRASEEKYRMLFNSIDAGFCIVELIYDESNKAVDYCFREVNKVFERQTGMQDVTGKYATEVAPNVEQSWIDTVDKVARTGESLRTEAFFEDPDRWYSISMSRVGDASSKLVGSVFDDITERKLREQHHSYLLRLTDALRTVSDPNEVQKLATSLLGEHLKSNCAHYGEAVGEDLLIQHSYADGLPPLTGHFHAEEFAKVFPEICRPEIKVVNNVALDTSLTNAEKLALQKAGIAAYISVPLYRDGILVATLSVQNIAVRNWTDQEVEAVRETAERSWLIVERAKTEQALRESEAWMKGQKHAFQTAMSGKPLAASLEALVAIAAAQTNGEARAAFYIISPGQEKLQLVAGTSVEYAGYVNKMALKPDALTCGLALHTGKQEIISDIETDDRWEGCRSLARTLGYRACWSFPVQAEEGPVIGTFAMCFQQPRIPTERELELAGIVSQAAAIIISRDRESQARVQIEEALRKSESLLTTVLQVSPVGLGFTDVNGNFLLLNDKLRRFLPTAKLPSLDDERFDRWVAFNPDGSRVERENFPGVRALSGNPVEPYLDILYTDDQGIETWTRVATIPLRSNTQEIIGAVTVITDINELKRTTEALQKSEQQLKLLLNQKDEFIGIASHELRTPVTSIKVYAELIEETLQETNNVEIVGMIRKLNVQVDRLAALIYLLLDTTRIVEGKLQLEKSKFSIDELITDTVEIMQRIVPGHRIELQLEDCSAIVFADRERLRQVLVNLISNAVKYSPNSDRIIVRSGKDEEQVKICVEDFGIGISEQGQQRVFERFFRDEETGTFAGLGLGLFISTNIIREHGGKIWVNSMKGNGALFCFTVPCA